MNPNPRSGQFSFDSIYLIIAAFVVVAVGVTLLNFHINRYYSANSNNDISEVYTKILMEVRDDAKLASRIKLQGQTTSFLNQNDDIISSYSLEDGKLIKTNPTLSKPKTLITNLNTAEFWTNQQLPNLVSLRLTPNTEEDIPFFTSFALRGYTHE